MKDLTLTNPTDKPVYAEIDPSADDRVAVVFPYSPAHVKRIKDVPGRTFRPREKTALVDANGAKLPYWRLPLDLNVMRRLREAFGDELGLGANLTAWGHEEVAKERNLKELSQADDAKLENVNDGLADWLRPYQRADVKFMSHANVLNANQPRTGKTPETIVSMIEGGHTGGHFHLVIAPVTSLETTWKRQIEAIYEKAGLTAPVVLTGQTPEERREATGEAVAIFSKMPKSEKARVKRPDVWLVLNPYAVQLKTKMVEKIEGKPESAVKVEELVYPELLEVEWTSFTVDEFHLMGLSNPATNGHKGVMLIAEATQPKRKFALSGTPMGGKPIKLWGALKFLSPDEFPSRWNWARQWLVINKGAYGSDIEGILPGREVEFYEHLKPFLVRRTRREELPGLPKEVVEDVWCDMTPKQAEQYHQFLLEAEWKLEDDEENGRLTATNVLAEYTRLKQFASAYCRVYRKANDNIEVMPTEDSAKLTALLGKLEELGVVGGDRKAVVVSQFRPMVEMVTNALNERGVSARMIRGGVSGKERVAIQDEFQTGDLQVVVLNTVAGGTAITLDAADNIHLLDETWVPDNQEQAADRIVPTTDEAAEARVTTGHYYYRTKGTIEEYIQKLVADKQMNNRTILDLRRRMQKEAAKLRELAEA